MLKRWRAQVVSYFINGILYFNHRKGNHTLPECEPNFNNSFLTFKWNKSAETKLAEKVKWQRIDENGRIIGTLGKGNFPSFQKSILDFFKEAAGDLSSQPLSRDFPNRFLVTFQT